MAKQTRRVSKTSVYHVMMRGINRQLIFEEEEDYTRFLSYTLDSKEIFRFKLLAYCLMSNHVHLLIKDENDVLSKSIHRLSSRYAAWFNRKYDRCGPLFQGRFKSEVIESDSYLSTVLIYIFQNPVKAGICTKAKDYRWSSRRFLGAGGALIDDDDLFRLLDFDDIETQEISYADASPLERGLGIRNPLSDEEVFTTLKTVSHTKNITDFQKLDTRSQAVAFYWVHQRGATYRQLARLSGIGKNSIERRCIRIREECSSRE